jgi:methylenetetrahydrofolate reductase (NADPH)
MSTLNPFKPARIIDLLHAEQPAASVEFFPPQNDEGNALLWNTVSTLKQNTHPAYVSITYGAGGSTRSRTMEIARRLQNEYHFTVMVHLTCVGSSRNDLEGIIEELYQGGFRNIMALRGDPPKGETSFQQYKDGFRYGGDLVELIKKLHPDICVGGGAYPEKHPEAASLETDLDSLKRKVDQGADFLTTQLFFDNEVYFRFVERCRRAGIQVPIVPGILPVLSLSQVRRFCKMCGSTLPRALERQLERVESNDEAVQSVGIAWAWHQIRDLLRSGAPGYHLYILNRAPAALALFDAPGK